MADTPAPAPPPASAVKDGIVTLAGIPRDPAAAAGRGKAPSVDVTADPHYADPTQDPLWAQFEHAEKESLHAQSSPAQARDAAMVAKLPPELAALLGPAGMQKLGGPAPAVPAPAAAPAAPAAPGQQTTPASEATEKRIKALAALKRDGWKDSMIQKLADEELLEVGLQRHESQATIDAKLNERRQNVRETQTQQAPTATPESGATPASGGPGQTAPPTFDGVVKEIAGEFGRHFTEQFGEEVGKPVSAAMEAGLRKLASHFDGQQQRTLKGLELLAEFAENTVASDVRRSWATEFPQTADKAVWDKIEETYDRLVAAGAYQGWDGMREAYEHARRIVLHGVAPTSAAQRSAQQIQLETQRVNGGPTVGARGAATAVRSEEQAEFEQFLRAHQLSDAALQIVGPGLLAESQART